MWHLSTFPVLLLIVAIFCQVVTSTNDGGYVSYTKSLGIRLHPGEDLMEGIVDTVRKHGFKAAAVATCVGSLTEARIRFANQTDLTTLTGPFEIVSLTGTIGPDGPHIHISISNGVGQTFGGHLVTGSKIYTTAEIVLLESRDLVFSREIDPETTWDELKIHRR
eukprot:TRINITY_DN43801_c0_g1_i1.p1 TRINITY_DN43801_c0_g1~~TRINITY_DN43801_c0_g1_i1.p1  ORF type:complete len:164 (-),score=8.72 TRINITY_DN43801_c0_g1_i1:44-535(-)